MTGDVVFEILRICESLHKNKAVFIVGDTGSGKAMMIGESCGDSAGPTISRGGPTVCGPWQYCALMW
jgi:hypothetical protein